VRVHVVYYIDHQLRRLYEHLSRYNDALDVEPPVTSKARAHASRFLMGRSR
jgi:hypothetical protein